MAARHPLETFNLDLPQSRRYLDSTVLRQMFYFEQDVRRPYGIEVNKIDQPVLLDYYLEGWSKWSRETLQ